MLGASFRLKVSPWVLAKYRNPEEAEEGMASTSSKDASILYDNSLLGQNQDHAERL